jgi:hypothetical protein
MKHETGTNQENNNLILQNQPFKNYFPKHDASKDNLLAFNVNYKEEAFVVEWQMANEKQEFSAKHK